MGNRGGAREGAGRRTKAEILGLSKTLEECISLQDEKKIWSVVKKQALEGSIQHAQLYFGYKYGKPSEHIISEQESETIVRIVRNGINGQSENPALESAVSSSEPEAL